MLGQLTALMDSQAQEISVCTYDVCGRRLSETRDGALTRAYEWDNLGYLARLIRVDSEGISEVSVSHDVFGNLATLTTGEETTGFVWDDASPIPSLLRAGNMDVFTVLGHTAYGTPEHNTGWVNHGWRTTRPTNPTNPWGIPPAIASFSSLRGNNATEAISSPSPWNVLLGGSISVFGLELMGARAYDPSTHSFLTTDPLPPVPGTPYAGNPYEYAGNNPLALFDPLGLRALTDAEFQTIAKGYNNNLELSAKSWWESNSELIYGIGDIAIAIFAAVLAVAGAPESGGASLLLFGIAGSRLEAGISRITQWSSGNNDPGEVVASSLIGFLTGGIGFAAIPGAKVAEGITSIGGQIAYRWGIGSVFGTIDYSIVAIPHATIAEAYDTYVVDETPYEDYGDFWDRTKARAGYNYTHNFWRNILPF